MASLQKNVAGQHVTFGLVSPSTGQPVTGASVTVYVTKDNGAQAIGGGTVTEKGHGQYDYGPTQAETNAADVGFMFTATGAVCVNLNYYPDIVDANGLRTMNVGDWQGAPPLPLAGFNGVTGLVQTDLEAVAYEEVGDPALLTGNQVNANVVEFGGQFVNSAIGGKIDAAPIILQAAVNTATTTTVKFTQNFSPPLLSTINNFYNGCIIFGQIGETEAQVSSVITGWNGATLTATVWPPLLVVPGNPDFLTIAHNLGGTVNVGAWNGAAVLALPTNFTLLAIDGAGGVTVGTNDDKTGYSLVESFPPNFGALAIDGSGGVTVGAVEAAASNVKKGQPLAGFQFQMLNALTGNPQAGLAVTATRNLGGGFAPCANPVTGTANGWYSINLAGSDTNANVVALSFTAPGAKATSITLITQP